MPGFSRARLDHFEAISPYDDYCGMCVQVYGKQSGPLSAATVVS